MPHSARFEGGQSDGAGRPSTLRLEQEKKRDGGLANTKPPAQGPALTVPGARCVGVGSQRRKSIRAGSVDQDRGVGVTEEIEGNEDC